MSSFIKKFNYPVYLFLLFFLCLIPLSATLIQHYPDEWHYISSALLMMKSGDYLTPHNLISSLWNFGGYLRLNKPIMSYWVIIAGFKIFGIHVFGLRIFFLLAGVLTMVVTAAMAQTIFKNREKTQFAVVILMTQLQFIFASIRAIPDILQLFFLTVSAYGLICLIIQPSYRSRYAWWYFYLGAAFAIESKGFIGLLFVVYSLVILWFLKKDAFKQNPISHGLAALTAIIIGSTWYIVMLSQHGHIFIRAFLFDQVTWRIHHAVWLPLTHIPLSACVLLLSVLPWGILAMIAAIRSPSNLLRSNVYKYIGGWMLLLVILVGCGSNISPRYLLPLGPLLAILCTDIILEADWSYKWRKYFFWVMLGLFTVIGLLSAVVTAQIFSITLGIILLVIFLGISVAMVNSWAGSGILLFFIFIMPCIPLAILVLPSQAQQIVSSLNLLDPGNQLRINYIGPNRLVSNIRLLSPEKIDLIILGASIKKFVELPHFPLLISSQNAQKLKLPLVNQKKMIVSKNLSGISMTSLIKGILTWTLPEKLKTNEEVYWLIVQN